MEPAINFVCEKCGAPAVLRQQGSTQGIYCTKCDWAMVTTSIPEIKKDSTNYEIRISDGDAHNEQHIKAIAAVSGANFLAARKLLQESEAVVFTGRAVRAIEARDTLKKAGVTFVINPNFPY